MFYIQGGRARAARQTEGYLENDPTWVQGYMLGARGYNKYSNLVIQNGEKNITTSIFINHVYYSLLMYRDEFHECTVYNPSIRVLLLSRRENVLKWPTTDSSIGHSLSSAQSF
jgi:hypothetical protein